MPILDYFQPPQIQTLQKLGLFQTVEAIIQSLADGKIDKWTAKKQILDLVNQNSADTNSKKPFSFGSFGKEKAVIDIHFGGEDHIEIHHKNEILQSEALGFHLSSHWVHNKFVTVDGKKMSKSLGNNYLVSGLQSVTGFESLVEKGYDPLAYRLLLHEHHYTNQLDFTWAKLDQAQARLHGLRKESAKLSAWTYFGNNETVLEFAPITLTEADLSPLLEDLDIPLLLDNYTGEINRLVTQVEKEKNMDLDEFRKLLKMENEFLQLGLFPDIPANILGIASRRWAAKKNKDWVNSDDLRKSAVALGYQIDDYAWGWGVWRIG